MRMPVARARRFQSTHPVRGATHPATVITDTTTFQSTHPVRGATHTGSDAVRGFQISIHAPREGCDELHAGAVAVNVCISIHAPREGCDQDALNDAGCGL